jgi:hypothetical protein
VSSEHDIFVVGNKRDVRGEREEKRNERDG